MKSFTCGDVVPGYKAMFEAETEEKMLAEAGRRASVDCGWVSVPASLVEDVCASIRNSVD